MNCIPVSSLFMEDFSKSSFADFSLDSVSAVSFVVSFSVSFWFSSVSLLDSNSVSSKNLGLYYSRDLKG